MACTLLERDPHGLLQRHVVERRNSKNSKAEEGFRLPQLLERFRWMYNHEREMNRHAGSVDVKQLFCTFWAEQEIVYEIWLFSWVTSNALRRGLRVHVRVGFSRLDLWKFLLLVHWRGRCWHGRRRHCRWRSCWWPRGATSTQFLDPGFQYSDLATKASADAERREPQEFGVLISSMQSMIEASPRGSIDALPIEASAAAGSE